MQAIFMPAIRETQRLQRPYACAPVSAHATLAKSKPENERETASPQHGTAARL
jgi:hypothetical protein